MFYPALGNNAITLLLSLALAPRPPDEGRTSADGPTARICTGKHWVGRGREGRGDANGDGGEGSYEGGEEFEGSYEGGEDCEGSYEDGDDGESSNEDGDDGEGSYEEGDDGEGSYEDGEDCEGSYGDGDDCEDWGGV